MAEESIFTQVAKDMAATMSDFREHFKAQIPAPFMMGKLTPREFKAKFGVGRREWKDLEATHGKETMDWLLKTLEGRRDAGT